MSTTPTTIAETYPGPEPTPVRGRPVHWSLAPFAALIALVIPRRMGPHLGVSSMRAAFVAHLAGAYIAFSVAILSALCVEVDQGGIALSTLSISEMLRLPLGVIVGFANRAIDPSDYFLTEIGVVVVVMEAMYLLGAVFLVPWIANGEGPRRRFARALKIMLWSTASATVVIGGTILSAALLDDYMFEPDYMPPIIMVLSLYLPWVVLRMGARYGGPAEGPGFEDRSYRCEGCGYALTSLMPEGRCPECGRPVADSLPEHRRLPEFATRRWPISKLVGYARTLVATWSAKRFAEHCCAYAGREAARNFALLTCLLIGLLCTPLYLITAPDLSVRYEHYGPPSDIAMAARLHMPLHVAMLTASGTLSAFAVITLMMLLFTRFGFQEPTRRSLLVCYASGWLVFPTVLLIGAIFAARWIVDGDVPMFQVRLPQMDPIRGEVVLAVAVFLPAAVALGFWLSKIRVMARVTRFANA